MKAFAIVVFMVIGTMSASAQYRDVKLPEKPHQSGYKNYTSEDKGFWCAFELDGGSSIMDVKTNIPYVNLTFTGGYRISEFFRFGAGFGGRMYLKNEDIKEHDSKFAVPIFANARGNFMSAYDRDGVPFWSLNVGGIPSEGFLLNPTIGYSFGGMRNNFLIGVSYTLATFKDCLQNNQAYSYFGLKIGYEF